MNIFSNLRVYPTAFKVIDSRSFTSEELAAVSNACVVSSTYGNSCCFTMKTGGKTYIPMARDAQAGVGEVIDLSKAKVISLTNGENEIVRIYA